MTATVTVMCSKCVTRPNGSLCFRHGCPGVDEPNVSKGIDNMNEINYEIKHVENFWRVFSFVTYRGKVFENFVGESATKVEAEMLMNKAKRIVS